jgi:hypothetical protein
MGNIKHILQEHLGGVVTIWQGPDSYFIGVVENIYEDCVETSNTFIVSGRENPSPCGRG